MSDNIKQMYERARKAFETIEFWDQDQVDLMVQAVGWELQKEETAKELARLAVDESGMGVYEDKVAKIKTKTLGTMYDFKDVKTCGVVEEIPELGLVRIAKPMGVVANVVPSTNPESTICCIGLGLLKTRNAMIVSPHPRTKGTSYLTVEHIRRALKKIGAPEDLAQCIKEPSHDNTVELMAHCDFAVATGGAALARIVHGAGTPCQTVGAGNVVSIVDETADPAEAAHKIKLSKIANNSASCSSENAVAIHESIYDQMIQALKSEGGYLCNTEEREKLRQTMWPDGKMLNRGIVAKSATYIAKMAGLEVPEDTKFIMVLGEKIGPEDRFSGEKISPVLTVWKWNDFDEFLGRLRKILKFSGEGHSVSMHSKKDDRLLKLAMFANVGRVVTNMPHSYANSGGWGAGLPFTDTLGGGTWAGNISSENVNWRHFLNYTLLAKPIPERKPDEQELFGAYFAKYGRD